MYGSKKMEIKIFEKYEETVLYIHVYIYTYHPTFG